jgi:lipooligosaccharide transport system permease protein
VTPMMLLCGVFFPVMQLPPLWQAVAGALPLTHAVDIARPLMSGMLPSNMLLHVLVLLVYTVTGFYTALVLFRRRLSQ